ncbi:MAG: hypothetical protein ACK4FG_01825 [Brevundimonas sp.]
MTYKVQVGFHGQDIANFMVTAFEGGSNYWIESVEYQGESKTSPWYADPNYWSDEYAVVTIQTVDDEQVSPNIQAGLNLMADYHPTPLADLMTGDYDAETADIFLQLSCFGEVRYD